MAGLQGLKMKIDIQFSLVFDFVNGLLKMMTRKLNCVIEPVLLAYAAQYAILGFEPIVSTNWIFDDAASLGSCKAKQRPCSFSNRYFFTEAEYAFKQSYLIFCHPSLTVALENTVFGSVNFVADFE